ncbi:MAG: acetolactate decarboxylase [bacterium]
MKHLLLIAVILSALLCGYPQQAIDKETLYQGSTIEALLAGNYDSVDIVKNIKTKGNIGLGTFERLDGEMIIIDGKIYRVAKTGAVTEEADNAGSPFYAITTFDSDVKGSLNIDTTIIDLKKYIDGLRPRSDLPYAIRIKCKAKSIKVRSVGPYKKPYPLLSDAIKEQATFDYTDVNGTMVGFWMPDFLGNANAANYHLHFISDDRTKGGHVLDVVLTSAEVELDETPGYNITFAPYKTMPLLVKDTYK